MCTLEAVAAALHGLQPEGSELPGALLDNMKLKVNALLRAKSRVAQDDLTSLMPTLGPTLSAPQ